MPKISRLAASRILDCLTTMSGYPLLHRKFCCLLTSILPRLFQSVLHYHRRNSLFAVSEMSDILHVLPLHSQVLFHCRHNRVLLPFCYHSRSHLLLVPLYLGSSSRLKIWVAFASRVSLKTSSSSRSDYDWFSRDEEIQWLFRRENKLNSPNNNPTAPRAANYCIVACREP